MWSREGIQHFMHDTWRYTQKGIHLVEQGVQLAGTIKGANAAGGMAVRLGGQLVRAGSTVLPLVL